MINLKFWQIDTEIPIHSATFLTIKDTKTFTNFLTYVYRYDDSDEVVFYDEKMNTIRNSEFLIVTDVLGYSVNTSNTLKTIYNDIEEQFNLDLESKSEIERYSSQITDIISGKLLDHELNLIYDEITISELLSVLGVKIDEKNDTFYDKIISIIKSFQYLSKKKILIFTNLCSFLTKEELESVIEYISLSNIDVLFLERSTNQCHNGYILDNDFQLKHE
ncbi:CRISPR-associated protein Csn2 [Companilactobacillus sp. RD055328]|uniref:type II-A CRISPR-associated protein Csn2 n=1 Tax=Companilactobacillus sp. RD055328 TaxID=2916634 RepID=UPI001FC83BDB|nr:type II-A CRISPR-associated protein Csn2 [Companilactobacillus sp. RD055328]GKQ42136.1 CRISPR-associated protein Csn2 [Companilactobacillus sp. RD055328]